MTLTLYETIQRIVQEELGKVRTAELAIVEKQHPHASASDSDNYACTVRLRNSGLVLNQVPVATQQIGGVSIPAVGELVLVQFVGGDINAPVITGRLYNDQDRPPPNDDGQTIVHLPLSAADSSAVHVELHSGSERSVRIKLGSGLEVIIADDDPLVKVDAGGGMARVEIGRDGAIKLESQGKVQIQGTEVSIAGTNVSIEAQAVLKVKGTLVNVN